MYPVLFADVIFANNFFFACALSLSI